MIDSIEWFIKSKLESVSCLDSKKKSADAPKRRKMPSKVQYSGDEDSSNDEEEEERQVATMKKPTNRVSFN